MPRMPRHRTRALILFAAVLVVAGLAVPSLWHAAAVVTLSEPAVLPGDAAPAPAAGRQEQPAVARGADASLVVWADTRTVLDEASRVSPVSLDDPSSGPGLGTLHDIYAARLDANGQVIDQTPLVVSQAEWGQVRPQVGWNGQNWLVTWVTKRPRDQFSHTTDVVFARVSPAGQLLDAQPVVLRGDSGTAPTRIISDAAGNWVLVWADFVPNSGAVGGEPRGVYVARVSNDGSVLDPGGRVVYTHTSQFLGEPDIARAGDLYMVTFVASFSLGDTVFALPLDANFNALRPGPERVAPGAAHRPRLASNGDTFFAVWGSGQSLSDTILGTRISRAGDPVDVSGINLATGAVVNAGPQVAWDGASWFVTYSVSRFSHDDINAARVSTAGSVLDAGIVLDAGAAHQTSSAVAPGVGGGAQAVWYDLGAFDVNAARVSAAGAPAAETVVGLGAPRQSEPRVASNGNGFLAVFRSETSAAARVMGQHLDANGVALEQEPFVIAEGPLTNNPSVAWNGSVYLAVWDEPASGSTPRRVYGRVVPSSGPPATPAFHIMDGETPDAAGLEGTFVVVGIFQQTAQIRQTRSVRVSGAGTVLGTPVTVDSAFNFVPRVTAFGPRFFAVWERHNNHDDAPGNILGAFISPADGTNTAPFLAGDAGDDRTPHLAVAGPHALLAWSHGDYVGRRGDVNTRRLNPDGTSPDAPAGSPLAAAVDVQALPAVAWDGNQYVVTWLDHRNDPFPEQPRGDIYAALVSPTNVPLEEFAVANSAAPEDTPFVASAGGLTLFAYAKFYPAAPYAAHRVTLRTGRFPAPTLGNAPAAPSQLAAQQVNTGPATASVSLAWADNSSDETGFHVETSTDGVTYRHLRQLPPDTTSLAGLGVSTQVQNYFRVRAFNAGGDSAHSNVASPPRAAVVAPTTNTIHNHPASFPVIATASDPDGVARVEFYAANDPLNGGPAAPPVLLGADTTPDSEGRYQFDWTPPAGYYHLTAKAFDAQGSVTTTSNASVLVRQAPTATISAPTNNATYTLPASVTLTASARTNNNRTDEHVERLDFYAGSVWIGRGTNAEWQAPWSFTWVNPPAGTHEITAHATSNWGQIGISAPVRVTVNPQTQPTPTDNVPPAVTLNSPAGGASYAANAPVTATATTSDADGVARVEFRANGFLVESDTTAPYGADLLLPGGTHSITAVAFDNRGASTISSAATVQLARPASTQLTSAQWDGQSEFGPSVVTQAGPPVNTELADDFDLRGDVDRVVFHGTRGFGAADNPVVRGLHVRFYAWEGGQPGALQEEFFLAAGNPGLVYDPRVADTFDVRLPRSFRASGKHFVSGQLLVEGYSGYWYWRSTRSNAPQNSTVRQRDRLNGGGWTASGNRDAVISLHGVLTSGATIQSLAPSTATRSSHFVINGTGFGETQNGGRVLVDNLPAIVVRWTANAIFAHVPEAARTGDVPVQVFTSAGASNTATLNVTARQPDQRLRWKVTTFGDMPSTPVVAPPGSPDAGSVYADGGGFIYAWSADGALKWVSGVGGTPMSVGPDGTVYAASAGYDAQGRFGPSVVALRPDGSLKWTFVDPNSQTVRAGPNVGPDGKVYVVFRPLVNSSQQPIGVNFAALRPDGTLAWSVNRHFWKNGQGLKKLVFGRTLPHIYFAYDVEPDPSPGFVNGGTFAYNFDGQLVWQQPGMCCGVPAVPPDEGVRHGDLRLDPLTGNVVYNFAQPSSAAANEGTPEAGPDNTHYTKFGSNTVYAINPNGTEKWRFDAGDMVGSPSVNQNNTTLLLSGGGSFNRDSFFLGVDPASGAELWRMTLPRTPGFEPYGNYFLSQLAAFSPDGATGYFTGDVNGDQGLSGFKFGYLYAVNATRENIPVNQPPRVTMTSPINGSNVARNTPVNLSAEVTDDGALVGVDFYVNSQLVSTDTAAPYSFTYDPPSAGGYSVRVVARDAGGLTGEATSAFTVVNEPPRVSWVSPTAGAFLPPGQPATLTARAQDLDGTITKVEFNSSAAGLIGADTTPDAQGNYSVVFNNPPAGQQTLVAWATDSDGSRIGANINVTFGTPPPPPTPTPTPAPPTPTPSPAPTPTPNPNAPVVRITSPAPGASFVPGTNVTLTAEAAAVAGRTIARVDFVHVPWESTLCTDFNAPYTCAFTRHEPFLYDIVAVARDSAGLVTRSAPVRVLFEYERRVSISGRLRHTSSQPGAEVFLTNALVRLEMNDRFFRETRTDAQGLYRFDNLSESAQFAVRPAEPGYTFSPPAVIWHGISEDKTQDFVAEGPRPPAPTPTPTPGANVLAWQKFYDGPRGQSDYDARLFVDADGNSYVAGITRGAATSDNDIDIVTVKYNPAGERLWARTFAGLGDYYDRPEDIRVDAQGNVYVAGVSYRGAAFGYDYVTVKYDAAGNEQWVRYYNGPKGDTDWAYGLALDSAGNVYVTGYITSAEVSSGFFFYEFATVKYDAAGNEQWVRLHSTKKYLQGHIAKDVEVDAQGNVYVTGYAWLGSTGSDAAKEVITVKYSPAGGLVWSARYNGGGTAEVLDEPDGLALDSQGNVYVYGHTRFEEVREDFLLLKYDGASGALAWDRHWGKPFHDHAKDIAVDGSGNVYLTGETYDGDYYTATRYPTSDVATVKFSTSGVLLWERFYRAFPGKQDGGRHVSLDAQGNVYVGAFTEGFVNSDIALIKYRPDGTEDWAYRYDNPWNTFDVLDAMEADASGNLYLAGSSVVVTNGASSRDLSTIKLAVTPSTVLNSPPDVTLVVSGPTIAGAPTTSSGPTIAGCTATFEANASDRDGAVARVDFYSGATLIGSDTTSPYSVTFTTQNPGTFAINAMATDNTGATRTTATTAVQMTCGSGQPAPTPTPSSVYAVSGQVTGAGGSPLGGVNVTMTGAVLASATTGPDGRYVFSHVPAGASCTVTPSLPGHNFTPAGRTFNSVSADQTADFTAAARVPVNLAQGKPATQSSDLYGGVASRAADGNTSGVWNNNSVTHTNNNPQPWWQVDLGAVQQLDSVRVWNRTDCCSNRLSNFYVLVSDTPFASTGLSATLAQAGVSSYHTPGAAGSSINVSVNRTGRYVRVQLAAAADYLSLAEVEVLGAAGATPTPTPTNLAQGKPATQSSDLLGGVAARAVDGNTSGAWSGNSVTHTNNNAQPWWQVDLGAVQQLQTVRLWNRTDCCSNRLSNFYVLVSDTPFASTGLSATLAQAGVSSYHTPGPAGSSVSVSVNRTGRYVRVQLAATDYLALAEVEVLGVAGATPAPTPTNLAQGKPATQSSDLFGGVAARAADGNTNGAWGGGSVTHTDSGAQPWWEVDLGAVQQLRTVRVWNRTDCCSNRLSNFYVLVSDAPFASTSLSATLAQAGVSAFHTPGAVAVSAAVAVNRTGRYVRVQLAASADYLSLAEVEVSGVASVAAAGHGAAGLDFLNGDGPAWRAMFGATAAGRGRGWRRLTLTPLTTT
jgi:hypothetical protein